MKLLYNIVFYFCLSSSFFFIVRMFQISWQDQEKKVIQSMYETLETVKEHNKRNKVLFFPKSRSIYICGWIDNKIAMNVQRHLLYCKKNNKDVYLNISTRGAEFGAMFQIIDAINSMPYKVHTLAQGNCAGFSLYLLMSGTGNISANKNCFFALINDRIMYTSKYDNIYKKKIKHLLKMKKCNIPRFDGKLLFFSANDALKYGVIDSINGHEAFVKPGIIKKGIPD
jgi:ATP-dependent protease ClpP protease subunit